MSSKTKIVVIHRKEVRYTVFFVVLAVILGLILFFLFGPSKNQSHPMNSDTRYTAGIYRSPVQLGDNSFDVEVTVSEDQIQAIHLQNLSESTQTMFPLMEPALDSLASQIYASQSLEDIRYPDEQKYTSEVLLRAITLAVSHAENQN